MSGPIIDMRMADGSRLFECLPIGPETLVGPWHAMREHVERLSGATLTRFLTDDVTEAWIDFDFSGHHFSINNQHGEWWFFVADPSCELATLTRVRDHFEALLDPLVWHSRRFGALPPGHHRVVVLEPEARATSRDFSAVAEARRYADDAASETENGVVVSYVVDDRFEIVYRGAHY